MQILGQQGDYPDIEKHFRQLRRHLWAELNIEPSAETTALSLLITSQTGCWAAWDGYPAGETLLLRVVEMAAVCGEEK